LRAKRQSTISQESRRKSTLDGAGSKTGAVGRPLIASRLRTQAQGLVCDAWQAR
jgi:hypothetical protein